LILVRTPEVRRDRPRLYAFQLQLFRDSASFAVGAIEMDDYIRAYIGQSESGFPADSLGGPRYQGCFALQFHRRFRFNVL